MVTQIAHLYATACLAGVIFQIALIAGMPLGAWTQGGRSPGKLPVGGRLVAFSAVPVLLFQGLAVVSAAGFPGLNWPLWTGWLALGITVICAVLDVFSPSQDERAVWGPISVVMAGMAGYVMLLTLG